MLVPDSCSTSDFGHGHGALLARSVRASFRTECTGFGADGNGAAPDEAPCLSASNEATNYRFLYGPVQASTKSKCSPGCSPPLHPSYTVDTPPSSMNAEYLYETNADESIFSSPPPVPVIPPSSRRHVASAIVIPTSKPMDHDPFGPTPTTPVAPGLLPIDGSMEVRASKSREINGKSSRKNPPPVAIAPVKMSPERKKADRQRHTIQLEYGDDAQEVPLTPKAPSHASWKGLSEGAEVLRSTESEGWTRSR